MPFYFLQPISGGTTLWRRHREAHRRNTDILVPTLKTVWSFLAQVISGGATTFGAGTGGHTGATGTIPPPLAAPGAPQFGAAPAAALGGTGFGDAAAQPQASSSPSPPPRQQPPTGLIDDAPSGQQEERPLIDI